MDPKTIAAGLIAAALFAFSAAHANESQEKTFKETAAKDTVTAALGIRRASDAVPYTVQTIHAEELVTHKDANIINSLTGKAAGLVVNSTAGGAGAAVNAVMRGIKSATWPSNVMYVIDGIPMYADMQPASMSYFGNSTAGKTEAVADINPEDIESISVLPGASAAALYGSCAGNGAILITTKSGTIGKTAVTLSNNTEFTSPFITPKFQNRYGSTNSLSWGELLPESLRENYDPRKDYFQRGLTTTESITISSGTQKNRFHISAAAVNSKGIIPNTTYNRYNFSFRDVASLFNGKLEIDIAAKLIFQNDRNAVNYGASGTNPLPSAYLYPRGESWEKAKVFKIYDPQSHTDVQNWAFSSSFPTLQNPYWINYNNLYTGKKTRGIADFGISYKITDWMKLSGRAHADIAGIREETRLYASTPEYITQSKSGYYGTEDSDIRQIYSNLLLDISKNWKNWSLHADAGGSFNEIASSKNEIEGPLIDFFTNCFRLEALDRTYMSISHRNRKEQSEAAFASVEGGFRNIVFLTASGRGDWSSRLLGKRTEKHFGFYWSAGASLIVSNMFRKMPENLSRIKIYGSYATASSHSGSMRAFDTTDSVSRIRKITGSWEVGLDMDFLKWFNLNGTFYNVTTSSPFIVADRYITDNVSIRNSGVELALNFSKEWGMFRWNSRYMVSSNFNRITAMPKNSNILSIEYPISYYFREIIKEGGRLGDVYSYAELETDGKGSIVLDKNGRPTLTMTYDAIKIGNVLPKANMSWANRFKIGDFSIGMVISARIGGKAVSLTNALLDSYGVSEASAAARDKGGVNVNGETLADPKKWYAAIGGEHCLPQYYTYSATNIRIQEASIGYTFPRKMLGNVCELTLQLTGRNLCMLYCKAPFDPEVIASPSHTLMGTDYFMTPSTRNLGFNVRLTF